MITPWTPQALVNKYMHSMTSQTILEISQMFKITGNNLILFNKQKAMVLKTSLNSMTTQWTLLVLENKFTHNKSTIFHTTPEIYLMYKIIDNNLIPFPKPMVMDLKTLQNNTTTLKIQLAQANKFMLKKSMTFQITQATYQMSKIIDNKVM